MLIFDIHNHLPVKTYLFERSVTEQIIDGLLPDHRSVNVFQSQTTLNMMKNGNVQGIIATHYVPEKGLLDSTIPWVKPLHSSLLKQILNDKIEEDSWANKTFTKTMESIQIFENKVKDAQEDDFPDVVLVKNKTQLNDTIANNITFILQAIEGGHHLGRSTVIEHQINNVDRFFDAGICYFTLGHFFPNDFMNPVQGLPPDVMQSFMNDAYRAIDFSIENQKGLSDRGKLLVDKLFDVGIIVDLTHSNERARRQVFEMNRTRIAAGKRNRPVIMSHVGVQGLFKDPDPKNANNIFMGASDKDIAEIKECNGVIGIILYNYWLTGIADVTDGSSKNYGLKNITMAINYIADRCGGSFDNISIGSDFDGMTDPPDNLDTIDKLPILSQYLLDNINSTDRENDVNKILGLNMQRALNEGWDA